MRVQTLAGLFAIAVVTSTPLAWSADGDPNTGGHATLGGPTKSEKELADASSPAACIVKTSSSVSNASCSFGPPPPVAGDNRTFLYPSFDVNVPIAHGDDAATLGSLDGLAKVFTIGGTIATSHYLASPSHTPLLAEIVGGIWFKGGPKQFHWMEGDSLAKQSGTRTDAAIGAFLGGVILEGRDAAYVRFNAQREFTDASTKTLCTASTTSSVLSCIAGPVGTPSKKERRVLSLEFDALQAIGGATLSVLASHDFRQRVTGVEVPVFFRPWTSGDGPLWFGVDLSWTNDPTSAHHGQVALVLTNKPVQLWHVQ